MKSCYPFATSPPIMVIPHLKVLRILDQIRKSKCSLFNVVAMHQAGALTLFRADAIQGEGQAAASSMRIEASAPLHTSSCLKAGKSICRYAIFFWGLPVEQSMTVGIAAGEIEQVDAGEDNQEAAEEGEGVHRVGGIEAAEEDERRTECSSGKRDVV